MTYGIVGVTLDGIPIQAAVSPDNMDPLFPGLYYKAESTYSRANIDQCLGDAENSLFYRYYSFSPCIYETTETVYQNPRMCADFNYCNKNL